MADQDHQTISKDGYQVTIHPAFASRCSVTPTGQAEKELFRQTETYHLPAGKGHPERHTVRIGGGPHQRSVELTIHDPQHHVARIIVEMYKHPRDPMSKEPAGEPTETFSVENQSDTCPPNC